MGASEAAAVQVLTRAVQLDSEKKYGEALACYEQGIRLLLQAAKDVRDDSKRTHFRKKTEEYLARAEKVKEAAASEKANACTHKQIQIADGATGHSYEVVIGPLITPTLTEVVVEDAYIRSTHQVYNFLHLCELLVRKAEKLSSISLITSSDPSDPGTQRERLDELRRSLAGHNISLDITFSDTIHDREIRFNNGWTVKIGRGLDYFKRADSRFAIGWADFDLRKCHQTTVDLYYRPPPKPNQPTQP